MKIFIRLYAAGLLIYTGWRTYDFMYTQLPKNDFTFVLAIAFLLATELGLILWHEAHLSHVTTDAQNTLTAWMTWIDFGGSVLAGIADMIIRQTLIDGFQVPREFAIVLMVGLPLIMGLNVAAVILYEQWDAKTQEVKARKAYLFTAHQQAMDDIENDRAGFAEEFKKSIKDRVRQEAGMKITHKPPAEKQDKGETLPEKQDDKPSWLESLFDKLTTTQAPVYNQVAPAADKAVEANGGNADRIADKSITDDGKTANPTKPRKAG